MIFQNNGQYLNTIATLKIDELTKRSSKFLLCFVLHHFDIQIFILNTLHRITNDEEKTANKQRKIQSPITEK